MQLMQTGVFANAWREIREVAMHVPESVLAVLILAAAVALALILHRVVIALARQRVARRSKLLHTLLLAMRGPLRLAFILLALVFAVAAAPIEPERGLWIGRILQLAFVALAVWMATRSLNLAAARSRPGKSV